MKWIKTNYYKSYVILFVNLCVFMSCESKRVETRYSTGELQSQWYEENGVKNGELKEYYQSGKLMKVQPWKDGKLNGEEISYHENGNVAQSIIYHDGEKIDTANFYSPSGTLVERHYYDSSGMINNYKKFDAEGKQTKDMALIIISHGDTISSDSVYRGKVKMGNISDKRYKNGTLVVADKWHEGLPLDTVMLLSSNNNDYPIELKNHKPGENRFKACIFYQIPLDTADATLFTQRCFEQTYYVIND
ncbi:MAG: hypothetical protein AAFX87_12960 [Bacteroidota bacterium]